MIGFSACSEYEEVVAKRPTSCLEKKISPEVKLSARDFASTIKTSFRNHQSLIKQLNIIQEFYEQNPNDFKIEIADIIQQQNSLKEYYNDLKTQLNTKVIPRKYFGAAEEMIISHKNILEQLGKSKKP